MIEVISSSEGIVQCFSDRLFDRCQDETLLFVGLVGKDCDLFCASDCFGRRGRY